MSCMVSVGTAVSIANVIIRCYSNIDYNFPRNFTISIILSLLLFFWVNVVSVATQTFLKTFKHTRVVKWSV